MSSPSSRLEQIRARMDQAKRARDHADVWLWTERYGFDDLTWLLEECVELRDALARSHVLEAEIREALALLVHEFDHDGTHTGAYADDPCLLCAAVVAARAVLAKWED